MATTDKQISLVEKIIQGITVALIGVCGWFTLRLIEDSDQLRENVWILTERVHELDKRVTVLEYQNGHR